MHGILGKKTRIFGGCGGDEVVLVVADLVAAVVMRCDGEGVAVVIDGKCTRYGGCGSVDRVRSVRCRWCKPLVGDDGDVGVGGDGLRRCGSDSGGGCTVTVAAVVVKELVWWWDGGVT
ncbi:hypothetical protein Tco_1146341 [Tanacetum coccineum]